MTKTALVTGASRGIGLETTRRFLHNSEDITTVVMFARKSDDFDAAVEELRSSSPVGRKIITRYVDVGDRDSLHEALESVHGEVGNIDILVNNAGYTNPVPLQQAEIEDFEKTMSVNVYAPFLIVKWLLNHGNVFKLIVNIASTAGINGRSGWLTYSASKAAVINMSQVMREELAIYGTRVVCLSPGRTATALRRTLAPEEDPSTIMQPEHVARVIETFASPVGRFIDSENIVVRQ
ncbi:SDR family oxidoreductase [Brachybacterium halotolerans subsp. kimchii]|jgi:3-oxoacyl-[acyl-carrier protein] reductase|uniref:SDR family NAD(P)-dependent oxidoreductase n=1 Tax=Brachybacterium TaxID=43668 RepID=UPI001E5F43E0|nr:MULTISPECIES: SDR family oxidoreductase [Brachybacterium]MCG7309410.1 SDR family oxidoreductase [Brachybacterium sp. ACRRE]UEJ84160.1 SDR family oxidoreductase [Brachybacterium halotolerans subsp. kimchii]